MAYDGITMSIVRRELEEKILGARLEKIYQPRSLEILLHFRTPKSTYHLQCAADPQLARVHLTTEIPENPAAAPAFCMLLRKHLTGARLLSIEQTGLERILTFVFRSHDDFGNITQKSLLCEIMGKHSNIILTMPQPNSEPIILGSIKTVDETMSRYRIVMPKEPYFPPPSQDKLHPFDLTEEDLVSELAKYANQKPENALVQSVMGIGKDLAQTIIQKASGNEPGHPLEMVRPLMVQFKELAKKIEARQIKPGVVRKPGQKPRFYLITPVGDTQMQSYSSVNEALDLYYTAITQQQTENRIKRQLEQVIHSALVRNEKKLQLQTKEIQEMENAGRYRIWGELLTASLFKLQPGMTKAIVPNYYDESVEETEIPLNPALSPQENAQRYFKKYRKLHDGKRILTKRIKETRQEINYLESLLVAAEHAGLPELFEIQQEMESDGLIHKKKNTRAPNRQTPSEPLHFKSPDDIDIFVGKNNRQNDQLTLKTANSSDLWLHVKDIPGSHVIIRHSDPPETTLLYAAKLAAAYSKAASSANVAVDYTFVRHVRKPKGAKPGMVIYDHHKTIFVTPDTIYKKD